MTVRAWTLDEANAALPRMRALLADARVLLFTARQEARGLGDGGSAKAGLRVDGAAKRLQALIEDLSTDGVVLRDIDRGLFDFRAIAADGRTYLLCWLAGEQGITWWHWPETGFAGRTPLTQPPE